MKITDKFSVDIGALHYRNCYFTVGMYGNGNLALGIGNDEDDALFDCTMNVASHVNGEWEICVKDYSENEGMADFLKRIGIIGEKPSLVMSNGCVSAPFYALTESGKELFKEMKDKGLCK